MNHPHAFRSSDAILWLYGGFYALCWMGLIGQLNMDWSMNPQYAYGWGVPFLSLYLIWKHHEKKLQVQPPIAPKRFILAWGFLFLFLLPLKWIQEANPDWRLVSWTYTLWTVGVTLLGLYFHGGRPWLAQYGFAVALIVFAVPWPTPVESFFVQTLMRWVAAITVEAVNWAGVPASQQGNLIVLPQGVVGVNEACSGVRSFQATLMAAMFLGDLYRLSLWKRCWLAIVGTGLAMAFNVVRSIGLTWITVKQGGLDFEEVHDPAGYLVTGLTFLCLLVVSIPLKNKSTVSLDPVPTPQARLFTKPAILLGMLWIGCVYASVELWYRAHERRLPNPIGWEIEWPTQESQFEFQPIHESIRANLRYNEGQTASFVDASQNHWLVYYFYWKPGRTSAQLSRTHSPEVCLPASGLEMTHPIQQHEIAIEGLNIPMRTYVFEFEKRELYVFFCLWEDRPRDERSLIPPRPALDRADRFRAAWNGERHLGQRFLEIVIQGPSSREEALQLVRERLPNWLRIHE